MYCYCFKHVFYCLLKELGPQVAQVQKMSVHLHAIDGGYATVEV